MLLATLALGLSTLLPHAQEQAAEGKQLAEVTYLANAGFLIRSGSNSILIDAFVPREIAGLEALDAPTRKHLLSGQAPFERPILSLISHVHPDHFKAPFAQRVLLGNPKMTLISSEEVIRALSQGGDSWEQISSRTAAFTRNPREKPRPFVDPSKDLSVTFMDLPHVESTDKDIGNIGHLVRMGNFKFLHLGDAAPNLRTLRKLKLAERHIDVAFVPYWFYSSPKGIRALDELIQAQHVVVYHIPTQDKEGFTARLKETNPDTIVFSKPMERKIFEVQKQS